MAVLPVWPVADDELALAAADRESRRRIAFRPVAIGSLTDLRGVTPGRLDVDAGALLRR